MHSVANAMTGALIFCALLGTIWAKSIPTEIHDATAELNTAIAKVEEVVIQGFNMISVQMKRMGDSISTDAEAVERMIKNATATAAASQEMAVKPDTAVIQYPGSHDASASHQKQFDVHKCGSQNLLMQVDDMFVVNADDGKWPKDLFCSLLASVQLPEPTYSIDVDLYNHRSGLSKSVGHLGLMYNAIDHRKFDFVYIRPHMCKYCYQTGAVVDGKLDWHTTGSSSKCPTKIRSRTWFNLKVVVVGETAKVYVDDQLMLGAQKMMMPARARGGVVVPNGYDNIAYFKNFKLSDIVEE